MNIFGVVGSFRPTIPYGWYPTARLQTNYRQYNSTVPQMLDYNKSGDTYVTLSTTRIDIIDWGGSSSNWLSTDAGWANVNAGFQWVCFRLWTNQQWLWGSVSIYLNFYSGWWRYYNGSDTPSFTEGVNSTTESIYCAGSTGSLNGRYLGAVYIPMVYTSGSYTYLWNTVRVRAYVNEKRADFSISGSAMYWTQGQIID